MHLINTYLKYTNTQPLILHGSIQAVAEMLGKGDRLDLKAKEVQGGNIENAGEEVIRCSRSAHVTFLIRQRRPQIKCVDMLSLGSRVSL